MAEPDRNGTQVRDIVVKLTGVSKTFRQKQRSEKLNEVFKSLFKPQIKIVNALTNISLEIGRGEIVAYAGPNGAGKSTTVKLLSGMLAPDSGTVRVFGMDPQKDRVRYVERIGVVFGQRTELWSDHTVAACYEWKRVVWDIPKDRYERMLGFVKEALGLQEFYFSMVRELSLGQRMRADLGMALLHEPEILFLDEPSLGLDVLAKRNILQYIRELNRERKMTVMVTSHDMNELEELAGRIVMVHKGALAFDGEFSQLRREFADRRVLTLETDSEVAPKLSGAEPVSSEGRKHEYSFDASKTNIAELLEQAAAQSKLSDVETHRAPIDEIIADIYEKWQKQPHKI